MPESQFRELIFDLEGIPTLPVFVHRLLNTIQDDCSTTQDLEQIIRQDPAMSSRILRVANSSFFGFPGQVGSLERAILLLGTRYIQALAVSISLVDNQAYRNAKNRLPLEPYWIHSFSCAWVCNRMIDAANFTAAKEKAFISGLLHDLGKPLLWIYQGDAYEEVVKKIQEVPSETHAVEQELLGLHHGKVGGELARWWKFPREIYEAIERHHDETPEEPAARLVQVADRVVNRAGFTDGLNPNPLDRPFSEVDPDGVESELLDRLVLDLQQQPDEIIDIVRLLHAEAR
jgi:putative nucleotidyltransferase with HDIG domain